MSKLPTNLTQLANEAQHNPMAAKEFIAAVYAVLRNMTHGQMAGEGDRTVEATEVANEVAAAMLSAPSPTVYTNRTQVMSGLYLRIRNKLIDMGRSRRRKKRGTGRHEASLDSPAAQAAAISGRGPLDEAAIKEDVLAINAALGRLATKHPNAHRVVVLRSEQYSVLDIANSLNVSPRQVNRWMHFATAFLYRDLRSRDCNKPADQHDGQDQ